jgi:glycosylphosphatidylinositol transamidase
MATETKARVTCNCHHPRDAYHRPTGIRHDQYFMVSREPSRTFALRILVPRSSPHWPLQVSSWILILAFSLVPQALLAFIPSHPLGTAPFSMLLQSFNLCLASTVISITSLLNFSLAATLAVTLGIPLICSRVSSRPSRTSTSLFSKPSRLAVYAAYWLLAWGWLLLPQEVERAVWHWEVLGVWFAPFVCIVYAPLVMQAGLVGLSQS